jgi:hypothetical protein
MYGHTALLPLFIYSTAIREIVTLLVKQEDLPQVLSAVHAFENEFNFIYVEVFIIDQHSHNFRSNSTSEQERASPDTSETEQVFHNRSNVALS